MLVHVLLLFQSLESLVTPAMRVVQSTEQGEDFALKLDHLHVSLFALSSFFLHGVLKHVDAFRYDNPTVGAHQ